MTEARTEQILGSWDITYTLGSDPEDFDTEVHVLSASAAASSYPITVEGQPVEVSLEDALDALAWQLEADSWVRDDLDPTGATRRPADRGLGIGVALAMLQCGAPLRQITGAVQVALHQQSGDDTPLLGDLIATTEEDGEHPAQFLQRMAALPYDLRFWGQVTVALADRTSDSLTWLRRFTGRLASEAAQAFTFSDRFAQVLTEEPHHASSLVTTLADRFGQGPNPRLYLHAISTLSFHLLDSEGMHDDDEMLRVADAVVDLSEQMRLAVAELRAQGD